MSYRSGRTLSPEETFALGKQIAEGLPTQGIVALEGDLGSGKTTLAKGIISTLTGEDPDGITSPTFTYMQHYPGKTSVFHFDLYRLKGVDDFLRLGFSDFFGEGLCLIEWPDRIAPLLSEKTIRIRLDYSANHERLIALFNC